MKANVRFLQDTARVDEIAEHLLRCDAHFIPPLGERVRIDDYAAKIVGKATRFEAWLDHRLIGLAAVYLNDDNSHVAFLTSISVLPESMGGGVAGQLLQQVVGAAKKAGCGQLHLEVDRRNERAIHLYKKAGIGIIGAGPTFVRMGLDL